MNQAFLSGLRILAVDPASRGLGYVVLEGADMLVEWNFRNSRIKRDAQCVAHVSALLARYQPDVLVLEAYTGSRRSQRIRELAEAFAKLADKCGAQVHRVPPKTVCTTFSSTNKYDIARILAARYPELERLCPPRRKIWKSEDTRINIFDALALALTAIHIWTRDEGQDNAVPLGLTAA